MSEELEALNELERFVNEDIGIKYHRESGWHLADKPEFHLIKSALERKEKLEKVVEILKPKICIMSFNFNDKNETSYIVDLRNAVVIKQEDYEPLNEVFGNER